MRWACMLINMDVKWKNFFLTILQKAIIVAERNSADNL